jgi:hypothetical protein
MEIAFNIFGVYPLSPGGDIVCRAARERASLDKDDVDESTPLLGERAEVRRELGAKNAGRRSKDHQRPPSGMLGIPTPLELATICA